MKKFLFLMSLMTLTGHSVFGAQQYPEGESSSPFRGLTRFSREFIEFQADGGNSAAMGQVAAMYHNGVDGPVDYDKARYYAELGAEKGDESSISLLGAMYFAGEGGPKDIKKGISLLENTVKTYNNPRAKGALALIYKMGGEGLEPDLKKSQEYLDLYKLTGDEYFLPMIYGLDKIRKGKNIDPKKALELVSDLSEKNIHEAQYRMGWAYLEGHGVDKNSETARKHFGEAAKNGSKKARILLGIMNYTGEGGARDPKVAREIFRTELTPDISFEGINCAVAKTIFAEMLLSGTAGPKDPKKALKFLESCEGQETIDTHRLLAGIYTAEMAGTQDPKKAKHHCEKHMKKGGDDPHVYAMLGGIYFEGLTGEKDYSKAQPLFKKALNSEALNEAMLVAVEHMYACTCSTDRLGGIVNHQEARKYFERAIAHGSKISLIPYAQFHLAGLGGERNLAKEKELAVEAVKARMPMAEMFLAAVQDALRR